ncbi:MAG: hypothetical protein M8843_09625, partial [marine benthic group bacterium]|nr:hypothetical protein [Gemmatimonadota bacterium]
MIALAGSHASSALAFRVRERPAGYGPESDSAQESQFTRESDVDPRAEVDALEELEEEIAVLAAHIHAATHRLLVLVAEYDRRRGWELGGHRSCAHWLAFRTGI